MKDVSKLDWFAIALAASGILVSAFAGDFFSRLGGLLTLLALAVAVYGFIVRSREVSRRNAGGSRE